MSRVLEEHSVNIYAYSPAYQTEVLTPTQSSRAACSLHRTQRD